MAKKKAENQPVKSDLDQEIVKLEGTARILQAWQWLRESGHELFVRNAVVAYWPDANVAEIVGEAKEIIKQSAKMDPDLLQGWMIENYMSHHFYLTKMGAHKDAADVQDKLRKFIESITPQEPALPPDPDLKVIPIDG